MSPKVNDLNLYRFNLHGSLIFDDYDAVSCLPAKGLLAPIKIMAQQSNFFTPERLSIKECQIIYNGLLCQNVTEHSTNSQTSSLHKFMYEAPDYSQKSSDVVNPNETRPVAWLVPLKMNPIFLRSFFLFASQHKVQQERSYNEGGFFGLAKQLHDLKMKRFEFLKQLRNKSLEIERSHEHETFIKGSERVNETRPVADPSNSGSLSFSSMQKWVRTNMKRFNAPQELSSSSLKNEHEPLSVKLSLENDKLSAITSEEEAEINHAVDFLENLQHLNQEDWNQEQHALARQVSEFFDSWIWLINELGKEFCSACIILFSISTECEASFPTQSASLCNYSLKISSLVPLHLRETLLLPTILIPTFEKNALDLLRLACSNGVVQTVITPLPLKPADHIYREIREKGSLKHLTHHGIYMGNGRVINFSGNELTLKGLLFNRNAAKIRVTSIINFLIRGSRLRVQHYTKCDPPGVVLLRAEKALVEQEFPDYDMFRNNCEHFCCYCKIGTSRSKQVEKGIKYAAVTSAVITTAVCLGVTAALKRNR